MKPLIAPLESPTVAPPAPTVVEPFEPSITPVIAGTPETSGTPRTPVASPETLKAVVAETIALTKPVVETAASPLEFAKPFNPSTLKPFNPSEEAVASLIQPVVQPVEVKIAVQPEVETVEMVAARTAASVERVERVVSASEMMVRAAEAVADAILVTPGLMRGEGEILIHLKPEVLDGSAVKIAVAGYRLSVEFQPQIVETAQFIERNLPRLQQVLVARIHSFTVAVSVRKERNGRI